MNKGNKQWVTLAQISTIRELRLLVINQGWSQTIGKWTEKKMFQKQLKLEHSDGYKHKRSADGV